MNKILKIIGQDDTEYTYYLDEDANGVVDIKLEKEIDNNLNYFFGIETNDGEIMNFLLDLYENNFLTKLSNIKTIIYIDEKDNKKININGNLISSLIANYHSRPKGIYHIIVRFELLNQAPYPNFEVLSE